MGDSAENLPEIKFYYLLLSPHLPSQTFCHRRLSSWWSVTSPWWSCADCSWWLTYPSCAWKRFPCLVISSPSQGL